MAAVGEFLRDHGIIKAPVFEHALLSREGIGERLRYRWDVIHDTFREPGSITDGMPGGIAKAEAFMIEGCATIALGIGAATAVALGVGFAVSTLPAWGAALAIGAPL